MRHSGICILTVSVKPLHVALSKSTTSSLRHPLPVVSTVEHKPSGDSSVSCMGAPIWDTGLGLSWLKPWLGVGILPLLMARKGAGSVGSKCKILTSNSHWFYSLILPPESKQDTDPWSYWSVTQCGTQPWTPASQSRNLHSPLAQHLWEGQADTLLTDTPGQALG